MSAKHSHAFSVGTKFSAALTVMEDLCLCGAS